MNYTALCFSFFGNLSKKLKPSFSDMYGDIQRAGLNYTVEEYISIAFFTTIMTFFIETITLAFIFGLIRISVILSVFLSTTLSISISGAIFFLFYSYPAATAKSKGKNIDKVLPFSTSYLATMSSSKLPPIFLFKTLSKFKEYGEVSKEAQNIARYVEMFGMTFFSAIRKEAKRTPSRDFKDLLYGINTVSSTGGDLTTFLKQKSEEYLNDYRRRIRKYSQDLSLFVEIYLTLIITGSIFFIVLSSVISAISGGMGTIVVQSFVVFILLPILSIGFILIIKSTSPTE